MNAQRIDTATDAATAGEPLEGFSRCHEGIVAQMQAFAGLPALAEAAARARQVAADTLGLFHDAVFEHHEEEERELFTAVTRSALPGDEASRVQAMVHQLTDEHRAIEALWKSLAPAVKAVAAGREDHLDTAKVQALTQAYLQHARFEEEHFLPLAEQILGRNSNHMAALGLSLHMRHARPVVGYI